MNEEELDIAVEGSCREYYQYLLNNAEFKRIISKVNGNDSLTNDEWLYILERLFLISYKSKEEEDKIDINDRIYTVICKIGMKVFKEGSPIYNECIKMFKYIDFIRERKEIDKDLLFGHDFVKANKKEDYLGILIKQHEEASTFRNNNEMFIRSVEEGRSGELSQHEIIGMNATERSYLREKELVKKYGTVI